MVPIRVVKGIMAFLCAINIYLSRSNLNIGIIRMVTTTVTKSGQTATCDRNVTVNTGTLNRCSLIERNKS